MHEAQRGQGVSQEHTAIRGFPSILPFLQAPRVRVFINQALVQQCFQTLGSCGNADSDSIGPGWGLRLCISNKFPGDAAALGTLVAGVTPVVLTLAARWNPLKTFRLLTPQPHLEVLIS